MTPQIKQLTEFSNLLTILLFPVFAILFNAKTLIMFVIVFTGLVLILRLRDNVAVALSIVVMVIYPFLR